MKMPVIKIDQIIASIMLKFGKCSFLDIAYLTNMLSKENFVQIKENDDFEYFIDTYTIENNCIMLDKVKEYYKNSFCPSILSTDEGLRKFCSDTLNQYMDKIDNDAFIKSSYNFLEDKIKMYSSFLNILIISDKEDILNSFKNMGFKNIDFFPSIIIANKYFSVNMKEFEKYNIVIIDTKFDYSNYFLDISEILSKYGRNNCLFKIYFNEKITFRTNYTENTNKPFYNIYFENYDDFVKEMIINLVINHITFDKKDFIPINIKKSDDILLPKTKKDIKILYLAPYYSNYDYDNDLKNILDEYGTKFSICTDNNLSFEVNVLDHLGDFDIIIATKKYKSNLSKYITESTNQCKITGRKLTLIITYESHISTGYLPDGNLNHDEEILTYTYKFGGKLSNSNDLNVFDIYFKDILAKKDCAKINIESALLVYSDMLYKLTSTKLDIPKFKTAHDYNKEYKAKKEKIEEEINKLMNPINNLNEAYKNAEFLLDRNSKLDNLNITVKNDHIYIENLYNQIVMCTIEFEVVSYNYISFLLQTRSKKGNLSPQKRLGFYTKQYENLENIPKIPDENEMNAIISIEKKIKSVLK